jgi:hypothetical protein
VTARDSLSSNRPSLSKVSPLRKEMNASRLPPHRTTSSYRAGDMLLASLLENLPSLAGSRGRAARLGKVFTGLGVEPGEACGRWTRPQMRLTLLRPGKHAPTIREFTHTPFESAGGGRRPAGQRRGCGLAGLAAALPFARRRKAEPTSPDVHGHRGEHVAAPGRRGY